VYGTDTQLIHLLTTLTTLTTQINAATIVIGFVRPLVVVALQRFTHCMEVEGVCSPLSHQHSTIAAAAASQKTVSPVGGLLVYF
jgi:hypothetical protein